MPENIKPLQESLHGMTHDMEAMSQHSRDIHQSFGQMLKAFVVYESVAASVKQLFASTILGQAVKAVHTGLSASREELVRSATALRGRLTLTEQINGVAKAGMETEHKRISAHLKVNELQRELQTRVAETHGITKLWLVTVGTGLVRLRSISAQLNQDIIEANSALSHRFSIMQKTLEVQRLTGESFEDITESAKALVHYGLDERETFRDNLKLVTMLKEGIGMQTHESALLFTIWERQLGQSTRRVADVMAQIVNSTALAANEAGRLATNIARAVGAMRQGVSGDLSAVIKLVAGYEDVLKRLGGESGGFSDLLTKLTRSEGMLGAGILGVGNPEFLASEQAAKAVIQRFGSYVNGFLGSTRGWERQMRLEALAEQFGTTAEQVNVMARAVREHTGEISDSISLEQRYREQLVASGHSLSNLLNKLKAVLYEAILPLLYVSTKVVDVITQVVGWLAEYKLTVYVVMGALIATLPIAIREIVILTRALWSLAMAARAAALSRIGGVGGVAGAGGILAGLRAAIAPIAGMFTLASLPIVVTLAAIAAVLGRAYYIWTDIRKLQVESLKRDDEIRVLRANEEDVRLQRFYVAARNGNLDDARRIMDIAMKGVTARMGEIDPETGERISERRIAYLRTRLAQDFTTYANRAQVTQVMSEQSFVRTPQDEAIEQRQDVLNDEVVKNQKRQIEQYESMTRSISREAEEQRKEQLLKESRGLPGGHSYWDLLRMGLGFDN